MERNPASSVAGPADRIERSVCQSPELSKGREDTMVSIAPAAQSSLKRHIGGLVLSFVMLAPVARAQTPPKKNPPPPAKLTSTQPTPADAKRFIEQAETR